MQLSVYSPTGIVLEGHVDKIDIEAIDGFYTLLPKHTDFVTALTAGITTCHSNGKITYIAVNEGVLIKRGKTVRLSTRQAILGDDLTTLTHTIETDFKQMQQQRKEATTTLSRLEIGLTKGLMRLRTTGGSNVDFG